MALSGILIGAADVRPRWLEVGVHLIAVDTLVHNFLHRTGILARFKAAHPYGTGCYRAGGCAEIIARLAAQQIDARAVQPSFPAIFPGSSNSRSGGIAASKASTFATATGSTTGNGAKTAFAAYTAFATEFA